MARGMWVISLIIVTMRSVMHDFGRNSVVFVVSGVPAFMLVESVMLRRWVRVVRVDGIMTSRIQTVIEPVMMEVVVLIIFQTMVVNVVMVWLEGVVVVLEI